MTQQPRHKTQKRKPLGQGIDWTDDDLNSLASITPADIKAAAALWQAEAPKALKNLISAKVEEEPK